MKQCQELLETEESGEIFLHCLGNAIKRGITLALKLVQESDNGLAYEANTSTIDLIGMSCAWVVQIVLLNNCSQCTITFQSSLIDWIYYNDVY